MFIPLLVIFKITIYLSEATTQETRCTSDWQLHVFSYIVKTFKPRQITLFLPNPKDEEFYHINHVLKAVVKNVSTMIVDTNSIEASDPLFKHPSFSYPRLTNMFVVVYPSRDLVKSSDVVKMQKIIDLMVDIAPRPTRPRCLLIIFGNNSVLKRAIESISSYAWSKKFIDFTTLVLRAVVKSSSLDDEIVNETVTYHYYNPFLNQHFSERYKSDVEILPGKLTNLHGYKLMVAATNNPPYVILERNETGYPILNHTGSNHRLLRILSKTMNFTFELVPSPFEYYTEGNNESLLHRLQTGEINLSMNHLFLGKASANLDKLERGVITISEEYTALMPITLDKRVKASKDLFAYMVTSIGMFVIFFAVMHIMKFDKRMWSGTRILGILLNVNFSQPVRWHERFVFLCIAFISFSFTINVLSELTEIQFEPYDDVAKNNLTLMGKLGYTPIVLEQFQDVNLEEEILADKEFLSRLIILKDAEECAFRLKRGEKIVCFMTKDLGEPFVMKDLENKEPTMKLMKPYLWYSWKSLVFEPGTPFLERFNDKLERLRDVGLLQRFIHDVTFHKKEDNRKSPEDILNTPVISTQWLYSELLLGYLFATTVLLIEVMVNRIWKVCMKL